MSYRMIVENHHTSQAGIFLSNNAVDNITVFVMVHRLEQTRKVEHMVTVRVQWRLHLSFHFPL